MAACHSTKRSKCSEITKCTINLSQPGKGESKKTKQVLFRMQILSLSGLNLANGGERGAGEARVTKIDGMILSIKVNGNSMQRHSGKCEARQNVKNQVPEKVSWQVAQ